MKSFWRAFAILAVTAATSFGQIVTESWDVNVTNPVRHSLTVWRGETATWRVRFMDGATPHNISASTTQTLRYAATVGAPKYYVLAGTLTGNPGEVSFTWGPGNEASAPLYEYDIAVIGFYGTMCRAKGPLNLADSIPGNPSIGTNTAASWRIMDWLYVRNMNISSAPWFDGGIGPWTNWGGTNLYWAGADTNTTSSTNLYDPLGIAAYLVGVHSNAVVGQGYTPTGAVDVLIGAATSSIWNATTGLVGAAEARADNGVAALSNAVVLQGYTPTGAVAALILADTNHEATGVAETLVAGLSNAVVSQGYTPTNAVVDLIAAATNGLPDVNALDMYVKTNNARFLLTLTNGALYDVAGAALGVSNAIIAKGYTTTGAVSALISNATANLAITNQFTNYVALTDARYLGALTNSNVYLTLGTTATTAGNVYQWVTNAWQAAVNTNSAQCSRMMALAMGANSTNGMLRMGSATVTPAASLSPGGLIFVDSTAGAYTQTVPTNSTSIIRALGHAIATNMIFFSPDNVWGTIQ